MTLLASLRQYILEQGREKTFWVAYSGGLDSHVLLLLCHQLQQEFPFNIQIIHVNHGLSLNAESWAQHCANVCAQYQFPLTCVRVDLTDADSDSLEAHARKRRYAVFADRINEGDVLLTGHHQDDQAETFLLQLLRGAGVKGLSAMPAVKVFSSGFHVRPLLAYSRAQLKEFAIEHLLYWIEDESNQNTVFARNYLRADVLPLLKKYWPGAMSSIARATSHCAEAQEMLDEYGALIFSHVKGSVENTISVAGLLTLHSRQQRLVLRYWVRSLGYSAPGTKKLNSIIKDMLNAAVDRFPKVTWGNVEVRRYRDDLYVMDALPPHDAEQTIEWDTSQPLTIDNIGTVHWVNVIGNIPATSHIENVEVKFRRGGEEIEWPGRGTQSLKNLFQEWQILPWLRDRQPLIFVEDKLVGVVRTG